MTDLPCSPCPSAMAEVNLTNGAGSLLAWAFTGIGAVVLVLVFANLGRAYMSETARCGRPRRHRRSGLLTLVNVVGIRESGWVHAISTALKFFPLLAIGLIGISFIEVATSAPSPRTVWARGTGCGGSPRGDAHAAFIHGGS